MSTRSLQATENCTESKNADSAPAAAGGFGQPAAAGGFGAPAAAGGVGGGGGGMFGGGGGGPQSGTGPPYSCKPEQERDNTAAGGPQTLTYHSISRMQVYQAKSFEELRLEDYQDTRARAAKWAPAARRAPIRYRPCWANPNRLRYDNRSATAWFRRPGHGQ